MRLYTLFAQLPYSLLISSLALAATAVPVEAQDSEVELRVLTPDDFDQTIAKGVWYVPRKALQSFDYNQNDPPNLGLLSISRPIVGTADALHRHGPNSFKQSRRKTTPVSALRRSTVPYTVVRRSPLSMHSLFILIANTSV